LITRKLVNTLGFSQLVCWGISYYLIGGFGELMVADLGWSRALVYGGFSASLAVMGLASHLTGRLIDRHGGRKVMTAGSALIALGCAMLSLAYGVAAYYGAWLILGLAMRLTLYEAAFAALARVGGPAAKRPISQITLLGGLSSTVFWPIGNFLAAALGWRGAVMVYAGIALATALLHLSIPDTRYAAPAEASRSPVDARGNVGRGRFAPALLYATSAALANFMNSSMSSQMIGILVALGLASGVAVSVATLRGIGQSAARLCEFMFGGRLHPLDLNILASAVLPMAFVAGLFGDSIIFAMVFALLYGAGNGLLTITRGTLPLILFDPREYGAVAGALLTPSFLAAAAAPLICALLAESFGEQAVLYLSLVLGCGVLSCALTLRWTFARSLRKH
jgi:MFS family permease